MSDEPITAQGEALRLWPDIGIPLLWGWRGHSHCSIDGRPIRARVWERLLERGDLLIHFNDSDPTKRPRRRLYLSPQGRERRDILAAKGAFTPPHTPECNSSYGPLERCDCNPDNMDPPPSA